MVKTKFGLDAVLSLAKIKVQMWKKKERKRATHRLKKQDYKMWEAAS